MIIDTTQLALETAMRGAGVRQQTLAGNLANVNTPGYQRQDVDFQSALRSALDEGDTSSSALDSMSFSSAPDMTASARADGNSVDVDQESAALAQNGLLYQALTEVASTRDQILQSAMGVR